tara:strand:+ start:2628 stop:3164 length:537 start_codon:yes stop_codon:yes gene_type:complete
MWALVENSKVSKVFNRPTAITVNDTQYPANIMGSWTAAQLKTIGVYEVVINDSKYKNPEYYINTSQEFKFASNKVTASYGTATAKDLDNLKKEHKQLITNQAYSLLQPNDWLVVRKQESGADIPSDWTSFRTGVRTAADSMKTKIDAVSNVDALAALYVYDDADPPVRPLGEFPTPPE